MTDIFQEEMEQIERFRNAKDKFGPVESTNIFVGENPNNLPVNLEVALTQQAYIDGPADGTPHYKAAGIDMYGNDYEITWEVKENWKDIEDESEMCDWDTPAEIKPL